MLIWPKVHIGQIFNFRVDADWTVRNESLLPGLYLSGLVGLWPNLWQWKVSRTELNQRLISEVEGKLEQNEKKSERKCHHFEKMKKS